MSKAARNNLTKSFTPGPGTYNYGEGNIFSKKGGKLGKASRGVDYRGNQLGPGAYDIPGTLDKKKGFKYGKGKRGQNYGNDLPGPGAYDANSAYKNVIGGNKKGKFGMPYCFRIQVWEGEER